MEEFEYGLNKNILSFIIEKIFGISLEENKEILNKILEIDPNIIMIIRSTLLSSIDVCWQEHINILDGLRQNASMRSYGQKDPLNEYRLESYKHYDSMIKIINLLTTRRVFGFEIENSA